MVRKDKTALKKAAQLEVEELFKKAGEIFDKDPAQAHDFVRKARRAAMKVRFRLPIGLKRRFCTHCYSYLKHGKNARVRIHKSRVVIYCAECRKFTRIPLI